MKNYNDWDGLCSECGEMAYTLVAQKCPECKVQETNSCFKRCANCAKKQNKCSNCDGEL